MRIVVSLSIDYELSLYQSLRFL